MKEFTRKEFLQTSGAAALGLWLAGCGSKPAGGGGAALSTGPVNLKFGIYGYIPQGVDFKKIVADHTAKYPNVNIEFEIVQGANLADLPAVVQKYTLEARQGTASYDMLLGPTTWIEVAALAKVNAIVPAQDLLAKATLDDLYAPARREATFDGKVYSFPWMTDVVGTIYRKSYLKEAVGTEKPPETWDDLLAYCEKIKNKYGTKVSAYGADWAFSHRLFLPILTTLTNKVYTSDGVWNTEAKEVTETLEWIKKLVPYTPSSSQQDLGSSKAFQAGAVAIETYWPAQVTRAVQAGQPEADIEMIGNMKGRRNSTIFWCAGGIVPKNARNKPEIARFMQEGLLSEFAVAQCYGLKKFPPYKAATAKMGDKLPSWSKGLIAQMDTAEPIPMNPYWITFEQPIFKEEIEKMVLQGQSVSATQKNLHSRIQQKLKESK